MISYGDIFKAMDKMPCHITDGPQAPCDAPLDYVRDDDLEYEKSRQEGIDDLARAITDHLIDRMNNGEFNP